MSDLTAEQILQHVYDGVTQALKVNAGLTVTGDIEIGAVELKNGADDTRGKVNPAASIAEADNALATHDAVAGLAADAAVITDANGTLSAKLRGLVKILADVWDSANHFLKIRNVTAGAITDRSGTLTTGATAQDALAANANRRYLLLRNPLSATEPLWFDLGTTAVAASPAIRLDPGDVFVMEGSFVSSDRISVIATTIGHAYTAKEG